jgi:predicted AAA+ superfamily ATPase
VASLQKTGDNFPKYIVTLDNYGLGNTAEGIVVVHLRDFLLRGL